MMSCITPTKRWDMWFKDRSVKTTEYSSSPSGSTSRRGRLTSADCHRFAHPRLRCSPGRSVDPGASPGRCELASRSARVDGTDDDPSVRGDRSGPGEAMLLEGCHRACVQE